MLFLIAILSFLLGFILGAMMAAAKWADGPEAR